MRGRFFSAPTIFLALALCVKVLAASAQSPQPEATPLGVGSPFGIEGPAQPADRPTPPPGELPPIKVIPDPIERFNRTMAAMSDGVVYYAARPLGKGYRLVIPAEARRCVNRFGDNLGFADHIVNNLLQGKPGAAGVETGRFLINTTIGIVGLFDPATSMGLKAHPEDFGQTFGRWGASPGFFFYIPFLGPSSGRDGVGTIGDSVLNPASYVPGLSSFLFFNRFSFQIDQYEILRQSESDPYVLSRDYWGIGREKDVRDFEIPESGHDGQPDPTMRALFFQVKDPKFMSQGPERSVKIPATGKSLPYSCWLQKLPSPLVYVLPGLGGHRNSEMCRAMAELLYHDGFSVVTVSGVFNWEFIKNAATAPSPGYTPTDADDIYGALNAINGDLDRRYPRRITSREVLGMSLGALHALFLAGDEAKRPGGGVHFDRFVAINPPVNPGYALQQLDAYYNAPMAWDAKSRARLVEAALMKAAISFLQTNGEATELPFSEAESHFLIGASYRYGLRNAVYESQRRHNQGVVKTPFHWFRQEPYYAEIDPYSYRSYIETFVMPGHLPAGGGKPERDALIQRASLRAIEEPLAKNDRVRVITNANDFVLEPADVEWLKTEFKDRLTLFPEGGHMGNLRLKEVQTAVLKALRK